VALRRKVKELIKCSKDTDDAIVESLTETVSEQISARDKLAALAKALGVKDPDDAVEKIASLMDEAKKLAEVMPELDQLRADAAKVEEQTIENDVEQAMASRNIDEDFKEALLLLRREKPEKFAEKYPKIPATPPINQNLKLDIATTSSGGQKPIDPRFLTRVGIDHGGGGSIDLGQYPGHNTTERAMSFIKLERGGSEMTYDQVFDAAVNLKKQPGVIDSRATA
jgi:hypothetical protein